MIEFPPWLVNVFGQIVIGAIGVLSGYLLAVKRDRTKKVEEERETARQVLSIIINDLEDLVGTSRDIHAKFLKNPETSSLWTLNIMTWEALVDRIPAIVDPEIVRRISMVYSGFAILARKLDVSVRFYWDIVVRTEGSPERRGKLLKRFATLSEQITSQIEHKDREGVPTGLIRGTNELIDYLSSYLETLENG